MSKNEKKVYFKGLNALRFIAASLVVLMHMKSNLGNSVLPRFPDIGLFSKGLIAVSFFFVLSGFLITYLLYVEYEKTKTISIKGFYLRRVFRIWPLYFLVIAIGIAFYWFIAPMLGFDFHIGYDKSVAIALYLFFGANIINSLYHVGGILHVTWSIAIEEQFYLIWAPVFKKFKKYIPTILWCTLIVSATISMLNKINIFNLSLGWQQLINTMQFHYMCIGGLLAHEVYHNKNRLLKKVVFTSKKVQYFLLALLLYYIILYKKHDLAELLFVIPQGLLFGWLILNTSINPNSIINLDNKILNYLGKVSYGIYMYHMIVVYAVSYIFVKLYSSSINDTLFLATYAFLVVGMTIAISSFSFHFFEENFIKRGNKLSKKNS